VVENLIVGCFMTEICLVIQCVVLGSALRVVYDLDRRQIVKPTIFGVSALLAGIMGAILVGSLLQMALWAQLFVAYGEFQDFQTAFYHSVVNFTTLGYGDVVMSEERRLLGALQAANGVLVVGLMTGFLFAILQAFMRRAWDRRVAEDADREAGLPRERHEST
jgi:hypothetical protein